VWQLLVRLGKVATQEEIKKRRDFTAQAKEDEEGGEAVAISVARSAAARHALAGDDRRTEVAEVAEVAEVVVVAAVVVVVVEAAVAEAAVAEAAAAGAAAGAAVAGAAVAGVAAVAGAEAGVNPHNGNRETVEISSHFIGFTALLTVVPATSILSSH
jgi:hypothetical protein